MQNFYFSIFPHLKINFHFLTQLLNVSSFQNMRYLIPTVLRCAFWKNFHPCPIHRPPLLLAIPKQRAPGCSTSRSSPSGRPWHTQPQNMTNYTVRLRILVNFGYLKTIKIHVDEQPVEDILKFTSMIVYVFMCVTSPGQTKNYTDLKFCAHTPIDLI